MKPLEYYRGREQTYLKHFFLEHYLERVAYNIGSFAKEFVYVDGFSGPWQSTDEALEDTSFMIAIRQLRRVREGLAQVNRHPRIRCLFIERSGRAFGSLQQATAGVMDLSVTPLQGAFEQLIPEIRQFIGHSFALVFIDPTGWTDVALSRIEGIVRHMPGEVLINFMFDHINRFLDDPRPQTAATFTELFNGPPPQLGASTGLQRENEILDLYKERLRSTGSFKHVTATRILKPTADRTYFYLVYGTRHPKGIVEFRRVEQKFVSEQERIRPIVKRTKRIEQTGQAELVFDGSAVGRPSYEGEQMRRLSESRLRLQQFLRQRKRVRYDETEATILESPLVWEKDVKEMIKDLRTTGRLMVEGMSSKERAPKPHHILVWSGD